MDPSPCVAQHASPRFASACAQRHVDGVHGFGRAPRGTLLGGGLQIEQTACYTPAQLQAAVLEKRYEVQYVLYTLALHRLLKIRLPNYNYEQHIGGAIYMFLRGIETPGAGIHAMRPPQVLIETLDAAFEGMHA